MDFEKSAKRLKVVNVSEAAHAHFVIMCVLQFEANIFKCSGRWCMHVHHLSFSWLASEWRDTQKYTHLALTILCANIALHETTP